MNPLKLAALVALASLLAGCSTFDRLKSVGQAPRLSAIEDPTAQPGYQPVNMPMPELVVASYQPNSLFSNEARGFFKDQRAHKIGDILTVIVTIDDSAQFSNTTARQRGSTNEAGIGGVLGSIYAGAGGGVPGLDVSADGSISTESGLSDNGSGSVNRKQTLVTQVAAVDTQV